LQKFIQVRFVKFKVIIGHVFLIRPWCSSGSRASSWIEHSTSGCPLVASSESAVQEVPGALVGILVSAGIIPGIQLRVTGSLFELMGNDANSCIYTGIAVGGNSLRNATAAVGHSNPCILDGHIAEIEVAVPATVNCAKSALGDITANRSKLYI
jgi:hypothetical protein